MGRVECGSVGSGGLGWIRSGVWVRRSGRSGLVAVCGRVKDKMVPPAHPTASALLVNPASFKAYTPFVTAMWHLRGQLEIR